MKIFRSLLLSVSLASFFVYALPFSPEPDIAERENTELLPRGKLFADEKDYNKKKAIEFVKKIPLKSLKSLGDKVDTLHSVDGRGQVAKGNWKPTSGFRLDNQGTTGSGYHNLQVQINGKKDKTSDKTTVGGILVKGNMRPIDIRKNLVHAIMHPKRDSQKNEYLHEYEHVQKDGRAPKDSEGNGLSNAETRKRKTPRHRFRDRVNQKKLRKEARKGPVEERRAAREARNAAKEASYLGW